MDRADAAEFEQFVTVELPRLLAFARVLTGNNHDAWDLVQDTLVRMRARWDRIDQAGNPAGYARAMMANLNVDRLRRLRREVLTRSGIDRAVHDEVADGPDRWLSDGLASLTAMQRSALALRFAADLDVASIARELGCSAGTVKSHLSRGLQRLRDHAPDAPPGSAAPVRQDLGEGSGRHG